MPGYQFNINAKVFLQAIFAAPSHHLRAVHADQVSDLIYQSKGGCRPGVEQETRQHWSHQVSQTLIQNENGAKLAPCKFYPRPDDPEILKASQGPHNQEGQGQGGTKLLA